MHDYSTRLVKAMESKQVSRTVLAKHLGIAYVSVKKACEGGAFNTQNNVKTARFLGVSADWLATGVSESNNNQGVNIYNATPRAYVPLINWVRAGAWGEIEDHSNPEAENRIEAWHSKPSRYAFALTVDGDSMTASTGQSFPSGCTIIVDPERSPKAGDFVIAKDVTSQRATFKQLTTEQGLWMLRPLNHHPSYKVIEIDDPSIRVFGVVIEWQVGGKL